MSAIDTQRIGNSLHRLAKLALDTGEVATIADALALFRSYAVHVAVGRDTAQCAARQAALLTAVNAGSRAFLGGVTVSGADGMPLVLEFPGSSDLPEAIESLGGRLGVGEPETPCLLIGDAEPAAHFAGRTALRLALDGWAACVGPGHHVTDSGADAHRLAGIAGAAIALSELFQVVRGSNPAAGRRIVELSLLGSAVSGTKDWRHADRLPNAAWLIGLGNLGQACLWALSLLPYADPGDVRLVLQDFDRMAESNQSTSLLTQPWMFGRHKTRALADVMERRGFKTTLIERRFDSLLRIGDDDPQVALCGVDNALARAALEDAGFARVLEAGLGNGPSDFLAIRFHSFPGPRRARDLWRAQARSSESLVDQPAYRRLALEGADRCGLIELAGRVVGAPFVGALAGALVVSELVKLANGLPNAALIDLHLRNPGELQWIPQSGDFAFNPGTTPSL